MHGEVWSGADGVTSGTVALRLRRVAKKACPKCAQASASGAGFASPSQYTTCATPASRRASAAAHASLLSCSVVSQPASTQAAGRGRMTPPIAWLDSLV